MNRRNWKWELSFSDGRPLSISFVFRSCHGERHAPFSVLLYKCKTASFPCSSARCLPKWSFKLPRLLQVFPDFFSENSLPKFESLSINYDISDGWQSGGPELRSPYFTNEKNTPYMKTYASNSFHRGLVGMKEKNVSYKKIYYPEMYHWDFTVSSSSWWYAIVTVGVNKCVVEVYQKRVGRYTVDFQ